MEEVWKDIEGYEGLYQVSNLGRVKSFPKKTYSKERILTNITKESHRLGIKTRPGQTT